MANLAEWPWTSVVWLKTPRQRKSWFSPEAGLTHAGGLKDTAADRRRYLEYLAWLQEDDYGQKALRFEQMSKGWAVGENDFKKELVQLNKAAGGLSLRADKKLAEALWEERVTACLKMLSKDEAAVAADAKGAPWKVVVAAAMKTTTTASNPWIAKRLNMGSPFRLSRLVSDCRTNPSRYGPFQQLCTKCRDAPKTSCGSGGANGGESSGWFSQGPRIFKRVRNG